MEQTRNKKFPFKIDSLSPLKPSYEHNHFANQTLDYSDIRAINTKYNAEDNQEGLPDIFTNGILGKKPKIKSKGKISDLREINRKLRIKIIVLENRIYNLETYIVSITVVFVMHVVNAADKKDKECE
eukprot:TRINITY_DN8963_c0_g1_i6.p2 TRINITY_DN8963_c0_g1~~TRINITY_DN8963_c0_g1_i6.p2  ORF type:complete len:127 (-),score=26.03 TRINITY_DN8963_c0_g1_i6:221-601(-)